MIPKGTVIPARICIVFHSGFGHTQRVAEAVYAGAMRVAESEVQLIPVSELAAQQGMVWINLNLLPGNNHSKGSVEDLNRLGASLGVMTQSNIDQGPDVCPPPSDLRTAERLGERVASCAHRWLAGKAR